MGEAKRRGTRDERVQQARRRKRTRRPFELKKFAMAIVALVMASGR